MKLSLTLILILGSFIATKAQAEVFRWPKLCATQTLVIQSHSNSAQLFWLQKWDQVITSETEVKIEAKEKIEINLGNDPHNFAQDYSLLMLSGDASKFSFSTYCFPKDSIPVDSYEGGEVYYKISPKSQPEIQLKNLFPGRNTFYIEDLNSLNRQQPIEIDVESRELFNFTFKPQSATSTWVKITAKQRFHSGVYTASKVIKPALVRPQRSVASLDDKYFLMGHTDGSGDQFIVKISDPTMIEKARAQIANPKLQKIVFAKINLGHQGYNRNLIKKEKSFWSWSVTEVTNISDFGSTACNGFPQLVEDQAENWVSQNGRICFWSYRIKKELTPFEVMNP